MNQLSSQVHIQPHCFQRGRGPPKPYLKSHVLSPDPCEWESSSRGAPRDLGRGTCKTLSHPPPPCSCHLLLATAPVLLSRNVGARCHSLFTEVFLCFTLNSDNYPKSLNQYDTDTCHPYMLPLQGCRIAVHQPRMQEAGALILSSSFLCQCT